MNQTVRTIARGLLIIGPLLHLIGLGLGMNLENLAVLGFLPMFLSSWPWHSLLRPSGGVAKLLSERVKPTDGHWLFSFEGDRRNDLLVTNQR